MALIIFYGNCMWIVFRINNGIQLFCTAELSKLYEMYSSRTKNIEALLSVVGYKAANSKHFEWGALVLTQK